MIKNNDIAYARWSGIHIGCIAQTYIINNKIHENRINGIWTTTQGTPLVKDNKIYKNGWEAICVIVEVVDILSIMSLKIMVYAMILIFKIMVHILYGVVMTKIMYYFKITQIDRYPYTRDILRYVI